MQHFRALGYIFVIIGLLGLILGLVAAVATPAALKEAEKAVEEGKYRAPMRPGPVTVVPGVTGPGGERRQPTPEEMRMGLRLAGPFLKAAAGVVIVVSVFWLLSGWALLARRSWGRIMAIVMSILAIIITLPTLIFIPIGLAIGIYGLWALLRGDAAVDWQAYTAR